MSPGTRKIENHAISGQSFRQNDLTRGENEPGCRRRDVDNKDVSTTGVTLSRSRSNESRQAVWLPRGREIRGHVAYTRRTARLGLWISKADIQKFRWCPGKTPATRGTRRGRVGWIRSI